MKQAVVMIMLVMMTMFSACAHFGRIDTLKGEWYGLSIQEVIDIRGEPDGVQHMKDGEMVVQYNRYSSASEREEMELRQDNLPTYRQILDPTFRRNKLYERMAPGVDYRSTCTEIMFVNREGVVYHWNHYGWQCSDPDD